MILRCFPLLCDATAGLHGRYVQPRLNPRNCYTKDLSINTFKPCHKHELRITAGTETPQKPIESHKRYKQRHSFFKTSVEDISAVWQSIFSEISLPTTCSYLGWSKNELFLYLVLSVLTFQRHQDGNLFPGCTLASETIPAVSFIRSVVPVWFGYFLWQTRTCTVYFFPISGIIKTDTLA